MTKPLLITALCAILQVFAPAIASADSVQIDGVSISDADVKTMLVALHHALQPNDDTVLVTVSLKKAREMPAYDQDWHYAGTDQKDGKPNVHVWLSEGLDGAPMQHAIAASFMLGLADAGYGGTAWKRVYDAALAADSALGANATDPLRTSSETRRSDGAVGCRRLRVKALGLHRCAEESCIDHLWSG